jgi:hypothetical protein
MCGREVWVFKEREAEKPEAEQVLLTSITRRSPTKKKKKKDIRKQSFRILCQ